MGVGEYYYKIVKKVVIICPGSYHFYTGTKKKEWGLEECKIYRQNNRDHLQKT